MIMSLSTFLPSYLLPINQSSIQGLHRCPGYSSDQVVFSRTACTAVRGKTGPKVSEWGRVKLLLEKSYCCNSLGPVKCEKQWTRLERETKGKYVHRGLVVPRFWGDDYSPEDGGNDLCASTCLHGQLFSCEDVPGATHAHGCFHGWSSGKAGSKMASKWN